MDVSVLFVVPFCFVRLECLFLLCVSNYYGATVFIVLQSYDLVIVSLNHEMDKLSGDGE